MRVIAATVLALPCTAAVSSAFSPKAFTRCRGVRPRCARSSNCPARPTAATLCRRADAWWGGTVHVPDRSRAKAPATPRPEGFPAPLHACNTSSHHASAAGSEYRWRVPMPAACSTASTQACAVCSASASTLPPCALACSRMAQAKPRRFSATNAASSRTCCSTRSHTKRQLARAETSTTALPSGAVSAAAALPEPVPGAAQPLWARPAAPAAASAQVRTSAHSSYCCTAQASTRENSSTSTCRKLLSPSSRSGANAAAFKPAGRGGRRKMRWMAPPAAMPALHARGYDRQ